MHRSSRPAGLSIATLIICAFVFVVCGFVGARAQQSAPPAPPQNLPTKAAPSQRSDDYRIRRDVNLVVLHASVLDDQGRFVGDLKQDNFRVFEDKVEQKLEVFRREDIPITVGLVVDSSASMRDKRERVNVAALTFIQSSNRNDEVFVVNFNDDYYLDIEKDFTNDINELKEALERIDSRGITVLYDAIIGSLDHLKKGSRDKKVLLVVTDGEDNGSRTGNGEPKRALDITTLEAQKSEAVIYTIGLLNQEDKRSARRAQDALQRLSTATGGLGFFPRGVAEVESICKQIAQDIRNQYTLAYTPTNMRKDGSYRSVNVEVIPPRGRGKMNVRTRTGYYSRTESSGN
jgi:VWFA-related protein